MSKSIKYIALYGAKSNEAEVTKTFASSSVTKAREKAKKYSKTLGLPNTYLVPLTRCGLVYDYATIA